MKKLIYFMKKITTCVFCLVMLTACEKQNVSSSPPYVDPDHTDSLVRLLANPEQFHNREIQLIGYIREGVEESAIYPSRDLSLDPANGVWVEFTSRQEANLEFGGNWVMLQGTFDAYAHGHLGRFSGALKNVSKIRIRNSQFEILVLGKQPISERHEPKHGHEEKPVEKKPLEGR